MHLFVQTIRDQNAGINILSRLPEKATHWAHRQSEQKTRTSR